jgi:hypothetical protein
MHSIHSIGRFHLGTGLNGGEEFPAKPRVSATPLIIVALE